MKPIIFFFALLILSWSCEKDPADPDNIAPVVTFNTPLNNTVFNPGQPIKITGSITDNAEITEVHIHVTNSITGGSYLDIHLNPGTSSAVFSNEDLNASPHTAYKIEVIAKDRGLNETRSFVEVSCY